MNIQHIGPSPVLVPNIGRFEPGQIRDVPDHLCEALLRNSAFVDVDADESAGPDLQEETAGTPPPLAIIYTPALGVTGSGN